MTIKLHEEAIGGLCAGILGTVIGYPLDLVKTRMQTSIATETSMIQVGTNVVRKGKQFCSKFISLFCMNYLTRDLFSFYGCPRIK